MSLSSCDYPTSLNPAFAKEVRPDVVNGQVNRAEIYFLDQDGGDHSTERTICYTALEVEPGLYDVEYDSLSDSFNKYLEEYPCGAPNDLDEQVEYIIDAELGRGKRIRSVSARNAK